MKPAPLSGRGIEIWTACVGWFATEPSRDTRNPLRTEPRSTPLADRMSPVRHTVLPPTVFDARPSPPCIGGNRNWPSRTGIDSQRLFRLVRNRSGAAQRVRRSRPSDQRGGPRRSIVWGPNTYPDSSRTQGFSIYGSSEQLVRIQFIMDFTVTPFSSK